MPVRNVSRFSLIAILGVMLFSAAACGPTRESQENMARNVEQAQDPHMQPARQDLLPPPGNDPRLNR